MTSDKQYKDVTLSEIVFFNKIDLSSISAGTTCSGSNGTGPRTVHPEETIGINSMWSCLMSNMNYTIYNNEHFHPFMLTRLTTGRKGWFGTSQTKCLVKQNWASWWASGTSYYTVWPTYTSVCCMIWWSFTATDNPLITLFDLTFLLSPPSGIVWSTIWVSAWAWASTTSSYTLFEVADEPEQMDEYYN